MIDSPFSGVFPDSPPAVFATQFLISPEDHQRVMLHGEMSRIWFRYGWMRPIFWLLSRFNLLIGKTGENIPVTLEIRAYRDAQGLPYQTYKRRLTFDTIETFNTVTAYLPRQQRTIEYFGPGNIVFMMWSAVFVPPDRLNMNTSSFGIRVFGAHFALPSPLAAWLIGRADFVQRAFDAETTSIDLVIRHPILGDLFGYSGTFKVHVKLLAQEYK